jgi:hypothetical protein
VGVLEHADCWPLKRTLESERIDKIEFLPHDDAATCLLYFVDCKVAVFEIEVGIFTSIETNELEIILLGEDLLFVLFGLVVVFATVYKKVLMSRMSMEIAVHIDIPGLKGLLEHLFNSEGLDKLFCVWCHILTVEVKA